MSPQMRLIYNELMDGVALSEYDKMILLKALTVANIHGDDTANSTATRTRRSSAWSSRVWNR